MFGIINKLIRLIKVTKGDSTYYVMIGPMMTGVCKIGNGLKQGDGLAFNLFNSALKCVIRQLPVHVKSTIFYKSVQLIGYADDITSRKEQIEVFMKYTKNAEQERKRSRAQHQCQKKEETNENKSNGRNQENKKKKKKKK